MDMEKVGFESYCRINGHDEFLEWLVTLPKKDSAKLLRLIEETEKQGLLIAQRMKWVKQIDKNLYELRSKVGSNIQRVIYFHVVDGRYVITHGFTKKTAKTPRKEILRAKAIREEWFTHEDF